MKKLITLFILIATCFSLAVMAACDFETTDNGDAGCHHIYSNKITKTATCKETGIRTYTCIYCEESYTEETPKSTNHVYSDGEFTKIATCKEKGEKIYTCTICNVTYTEEIPQTAHNYTDGRITKQATCVEDGILTYSCSYCDHSYTENYSLEKYTASTIYTMVEDSVGEIIVYDKSGDELALGTCFVYTENGQIITNYHVIEDSYSAKVTIAGNEYTVSKILAYDKKIDLAILKISATGLKKIDFCTNAHAVGKSVFAIGSSKGLTSTFSQGIITTADRVLDGVSYIQHDAAISSGNSGGPLINEYCEVIGINTMTIKDSQNLNFAINVTEINNLDFSKEIDYGKHNQESGSSGSDNTEPTTGLYTTMKNLAISKGTYEDGVYEYEFYESANFVYGLKYDTSKKVVEFTLFYVDDSQINCDMIFITIDSVDGVYDWSYIATTTTFTYYDWLDGVLYASSWTENSTLSVSDYIIESSSSVSTLKSSASASLDILLKGIDKYLSSYGITAKALGFTNFSSSTTTSDLFTTIKNYVISYGTYDDGEYEVLLGTKYSSNYKYTYRYSVQYDTSTKEISFQIFGYSTDGFYYLVYIDIDKVDGTYEWSYIDNYYYIMYGEVNGSTWDTGYLLGYSYCSTTNSTLKSSIRELASVSLNALLDGIDEYLGGKGITAKKLGFVNF